MIYQKYLKVILKFVFFFVYKRTPILIVKFMNSVNKYRITVFTGKQRGAGTDADVSLVLYGKLSDSGEWRLDDEKNNFERGK